jgi:hypothetical protein
MKCLISVCIALLVTRAVVADDANTTSNTDAALLARGYVKEVIVTEALAKWTLIGKGRLEKNHDQLLIGESKNSKGVMLVSPRSYEGDVIFRYNVMVLQPATVMVTDLATCMNNGEPLSFPEDYNGNIGYMFNNLSMYNFVYHNAAHNKAGPFLRRYPTPGNVLLSPADRHSVFSGRYHTVEVGKEENRLWLSIDGVSAVEWKDEDPLEEGHLILRLRGTAFELASALIRNVIVYNK